MGPDIVHSCDSDDGSTALHESCMGSDNSEVTEFLLESGAKVNAVDTNGRTPLFWSISRGHLECTKALLAAGATVNHRRNGNGYTPLDYALASVDYDGFKKAARAKIVEVLEAAGALTAAQLPEDDDEDGNA